MSSNVSSLSSPPALPKALSKEETRVSAFKRAEVKRVVERAIIATQETSLKGESLASKRVELTNREQYLLMLQENELPGMRERVLPQRRVCNFGPMDPPHQQKRAEGQILSPFITDEQIVSVHPMRFLRHSPFIERELAMDEFYLAVLDKKPSLWGEVFIATAKSIDAVAVTEQGRHVILQQAVKSCGPSCAAMLILDHGKKPDYDTIKHVSLSNTDQVAKWIEDAGLQSKKTDLSAEKEDKVGALIKCLNKDGPGVLSIYHDEIHGHFIVLDAISIDDHTAMIRDPFHGWALTMKLNALIPWICSKDFIQVKSMS